MAVAVLHSRRSLAIANHASAPLSPGPPVVPGPPSVPFRPGVPSLPLRPPRPLTPRSPVSPGGPCGSARRRQHKWDNHTCCCKRKTGLGLGGGEKSDGGEEELLGKRKRAKPQHAQRTLKLDQQRKEKPNRSWALNNGLRIHRTALPKRSQQGSGRGENTLHEIAPPLYHHLHHPAQSPAPRFLPVQDGKIGGRVNQE
jgi:hypothetical protein